jgi:hypothetical protein
VLGQATGVEPRIVHVPSEIIARYDCHIGDSFLRDKTHNAIFDNSKIKQVVPEFTATTPFSQGAREIIAWILANPKRQQINADFKTMCDQILLDYQKLGRCPINLV